jgi:hypothetical protein
MPKEKPSDEQIKKLPAWARDYIKDLDRERFLAVRSLNTFLDSKTPSSVYTQSYECTGETVGPSIKINFLQTTRVYFRLPNSPEDFDMEVFVNQEKRRVEIRTPRCYPYIEPQGSNLFHIIPRESLLHPNGKIVLMAMQEADKLSHDDFTAKYGFSQAAIPQMIQQVIGESEC